MNYRHGFHAGNFADVLKHAVLVAVIESLKAKPTGFSYIESHAGAGRYNLAGPEAAKTQEYTAGIARLLGTSRLPSLLHIYVNLVRSLNARHPDAPLQEYPGSPLIANLLMREDDRQILCELQDQEAAQLRLEFSHDARVAVHQRDGYAALNALLPPKPRRGLVLIDPPFEAQEAEFDLIINALKAAHKRWPTGIYAVWYPIKLRQQVAPFHRALKASGMRKVLLAELCVHATDSALRLNGCGMAIVNAPWKLDHALGEMLPALKHLLSPGRFGSERVEWLVED